MHKTRYLLAAACALCAATTLADVKLATIFTSNMVLQREKQVPVWGWAEPGEAITVSFADQNLKTTADAKGEWEVRLAPLAASTNGCPLVVAGKNALTNANVLVGDVWLCSGQSNMEMSFAWGVLDGQKFLDEASRFPMIRRIKVSKKKAEAPLQNVGIDGPWSVCGTNTAKGYTAAGYFFARRLVLELGVPVGLLDDNWSGCGIEPFMPPEGFEAEPLRSALPGIRKWIAGTPEWRAAWEQQIGVVKAWVAASEAALAAGTALPPQVQPLASPYECSQYNAMIAPLVRFPIKGALWYQGCSNYQDKEFYRFKLKGLADGWRQAWGYDFPFYYVQLAGFTPAWDAPDPAGGNGYARIRDGMRLALKDIVNSGMACTIDIGMPHDIHPKNKIDVGERLASWALAKTYGKTDVVPSGPLFKSMKPGVGDLVLEFDYADGLMTATKQGYAAPVPTPGVAPKHFAISGADRVWHWANAEIRGNTIVLSSDKVPEPVAVRYAFRAYPDGVNVYNAAGLPMVPFRTDALVW